MNAFIILIVVKKDIVIFIVICGIQIEDQFLGTVFEELFSNHETDRNRGGVDKMYPQKMLCKLQFKVSYDHIVSL